MNDILKEQGFYSLYGTVYTFFKIWANKDVMTDDLWIQCVTEAQQVIDDNPQHKKTCQVLMMAVMDDIAAIHKKKAGKTA